MSEDGFKLIAMQFALPLSVTLIFTPAPLLTVTLITMLTNRLASIEIEIRRMT